jgi:cell division protein FtsA
MSEKIITGIDLGSATIKIAVGRISPKNKIEIFGIVENESSGISKGVINDLEDVVSSLSLALDKMEDLIGLKISHAFVGISGSQIVSQEAKGVIAVSQPDGEIKKEDVFKVIEAAKSISIPPNYEVLHVLPSSFTIDNQSNIKDPIGMSGVRLEVQAQVIYGLSSQIKNLRKILHRVGINDDELIFNPLASAEAVLNKKQKELGVAVIDFGHTTTSLCVYEDGDLLLAEVLPIGSRYITSDIAIGLKISLELAELIKIKQGVAFSSLVNKNEFINLKELTEKEEGLVSKKELAEIIEARCEEIFKMVEKRLSAINRSGKLPAGIVLTGGGAKLPGLIELGKKIFKLPVSIGIPSDFESKNKAFFDPSYSTVIGLILWGKKIKSFSEKDFLKFFKISWLKRILKNILP